MSTMLRVASAVRFHEVPPRPLLGVLEAEQRAFWARASRENPAMYDGPILVVDRVQWVRGECAVWFFESSFSRYLWARTSGAAQAPALFASVLGKTSDGAVLAGEMSANTSTPHRVQLPGGNIERRADSAVTVDSACSTAARELREELGLNVPVHDLRLTHVKSGGDHGDVGIIFSVDLPDTVRDVIRTFKNHQRALAASSAFIEFSHLVTYSTKFAEPATVPLPSVDYMEDVVRLALGLGDDPVTYCSRRASSEPVVEVGVQAC
jgi:8-oxo-dGTP pyrophosphatase MutT (NUDIX family)